MSTAALAVSHSQPPEAASDFLRICGARTHNLKSIDINIPRGKFVVITGPSGSGKSSLAFDTLFAEGQRQYIESLSVYARQFLHQLERPDVDEITGLQPVICIDQRPVAANPRSTVATSTEIYDYLRLLFARLGDVSCPRCGEPIRQQSIEQIQDALMALPEGTKLMLLAPLVRGRKGQHAEVFEAIRKAGQVRVRVDGTIHDLDSVPPLDGRKAHTIESVVDRIIIRPGFVSRLAESIQLAVKQGSGVVVASFADSTSWTDRLFSTLYACPNCQLSLEEIEPRTFSFNSPYGACPRCEGLGYRLEFDPDLVVPDMSKSLADGAIAAWRKVSRGSGIGGRESGGRGSRRAHSDRKAVQGSEFRVQPEGDSQREQVERFLASQTTGVDTPLSALSPALLEKLFRGNGDQFPGLLILLEQEYATAIDAARREQLESVRGHVTCPACHGARLRPEALSVRIAGQNIAELCRLNISDARAFFASVSKPDSDSCLLTPDRSPIALPILAEITARLGFLEKVGLDYLTLDRPSDTLSGGELQRVRLATGIGSGLAGICYILDEPSIGLHSRDNQRLIDALRDLLGPENTVLVVEHDEAIMRQADWLIDFGPGAGTHGGQVVAEGTPTQIMANPQSITGRYLSGALRIDLPSERRN